MREGKCIGCQTTFSYSRVSYREWEIEVAGLDVAIGICERCFKEAADELVEEAFEKGRESTEGSIGCE